MRHIRGVYNGATIDLVAPLPLPPGTVVEVLIPEAQWPLPDDHGLNADEVDRAVVAELYRRGSVASRDLPTGTIDLHWSPILNLGRPIAEDILEDRR